MSATIIREWYFLLYAILTGFFFAFVYDNIRLLRKLFRHKRWMIDFEDMLFWLMCFLVSFSLLYYGNAGVVRFFAVLGAGAGMYLYCRTIGRFYVKVLYRLIMLLLSPYRFMKIRLTHVKNHFTIKLREFVRVKYGKGDKDAKKAKACISAQKK